MGYRVLLLDRAAADFNKIPKAYKQKILEKIKELSNFPKARLDIIKMEGWEHTYRLRVGRFRVLFRVYPQKKLIVVVKISKRAKAYQ